MKKHQFTLKACINSKYAKLRVKIQQQQQSQFNNQPQPFINNIQTQTKIMNSNLLTTISFGLKRHFKKFRKIMRNQALDYKFGNKHTHKNPHAIPLQLKRKLVNGTKGGDWRTIRQMERESYKPFGKFTKGGFKFDKERVPFYDIPNIDGFELKPYVDFNAPRLNEKYLNHQLKVNQQKISKSSTI